MVKWPKSCEKKEWVTIDTDISNLLGQLRGTAELQGRCWSEWET